MAHLRMHYDGIEGHQAFIKVDVNFLDRVPVMVPEHHLVRHPFQDDVPAFEIQTLTLSELAAAKLMLCADGPRPRSVRRRGIKRPRCPEYR